MYNKILSEISQEYYQQNYPNDGQRFVAWYLRNIHNLDTYETKDCITDGAGDKQIDAVYIDNQSSTIYIIQGKDYYSAETIRRFVRDTLTDSQQFDVLKEEIYNGIIDTHEQEYDSGYKRLVEDLKQAAVTNTSKSMLDSKLHCIGNSERKGVCHMLVNDNKLRWVNEE